jgi:hypothetical protein
MPQRVQYGMGRREQVASHMTQPKISSIAPFFIVQELAAALSFYRDGLGLDITFKAPADDPFFGLVSRGGAMIMLKVVGVDPLPNYKREPGALWDAYVNVPDPDASWQNFRREISSFLNHSRTTTMVCVDSNSRTLAATYCFSVVLGPKAGFVVRSCIVRQVAPNNALQPTCEDARG